MDQAPQEQVLQNDNLSVKVTERPNCEVQFDITVSPQATQAAFIKALKNINKEVSIPGFRKGKAPENLIKQRYEHYISQEWKDVVLRTAVTEAMDLTKIYPFTRETRLKADVVTISETDGATLKAEFEKGPKLPEIDVENFTVSPVEPAAVTEEEIDQHVAGIRRRLAKMEEVSDRAAEKGDHVVCDVELIDGTTSDHRNNEEMDLTDNSWVCDSLIGATVGQTVEAKPPEAKEEQLVKLTLRKLQKPTLPELNEEFFKQVGVKDLDDLREKGREVLVNAAKEHAKQAMVAQLQEQIFEKYPFEIPLSLLLVEFRDPEFLKSLDHEGLDKAKAICRQNLLCQKLARDLNIQITNEELKQAYYSQAVMASLQGISPEDDKQAQLLVDLAYKRLLAQKVFDLLLEKAKKA